MTELEKMMEAFDATHDITASKLWNLEKADRPKWLDHVIGTVVNTLDTFEEASWGTMLEFFLGQDIITVEQRNFLMKLTDLKFPVNIIAFLQVLGSLMTGYVSMTTDATFNKRRQSILKDLRPGVAEFREVIPAAFIAPEKTGEVRDIAARLGLPEKDIDLMLLASYRLYNEDVIRTLWHRKVLSNDQMFTRMRELGYTDTRIKEISQSWPVIPGPMDLFHLVAKEAFEPEMIAKMGLGDEYPHEQTQWLEQQGISLEWAKRYWYAHWDQPSIGQGYEMLHRGIIDLDTLDMLFRTVEIPPFWRDKLIGIAYMPYTRVDVRRMHDMGVLNDEELIKSYMDLGYDEEHALKMANFTIRYNRQGDKEMTLSQILSGYRENIIEKRDALTMLKELEYTTDHAEYLLLFEDYKEQKEYQDDLIDNIKNRYQNNLIEDHDARRMLDALNLPARQTDLLMDRWKIKRLSDYKLPSKSDLDKFLRNKIIDLDTYRNEMRRLGYSFQYSSWYEKLTLMKKAK